MAEESPSPEKQLLNLIEGANGGQEIKLRKQQARRNALGIFSFGALKGRLSFLRNNFVKGLKGGEFWRDLKTLNNIVTAVVVFISIVSGMRLFFSWRGLEVDYFEEAKSMSELKIKELSILI